MGWRELTEKKTGNSCKETLTCGEGKDEFVGLIWWKKRQVLIFYGSFCFDSLV